MLGKVQLELQELVDRYVSASVMDLAVLFYCSVFFIMD